MVITEDEFPRNCINSSTFIREPFNFIERLERRGIVKIKLSKYKIRPRPCVII